MDKTTLKAQFEQHFGPGESNLFFSPGRVNLIGEHTDYNGGLVLPCALQMGTYGVARPRSDGKFRVFSADYPGFGPVEFESENLIKTPERGWGNYPAAVVKEFSALKKNINFGLDMYVAGDLPMASGLSSSASLMLLVAVTINELFGFGLSPKELALLCQRGENHFIGLNCGIMDQLVIAEGQSDHAVLIDCRHLETQLVPVNLGQYSLFIANTNKPRELAESKYNERRLECDKALTQLQAVMDVDFLGQLSPINLEVYNEEITDETARKRATHVIHESARVTKAAHCLRTGDMVALGKLMNESHLSLKNLYEVTGTELDALWEAAITCPGVLGSRMTGAGFGGCTVTLVETAQADSFMAETATKYQRTTGLSATFYKVVPSKGAGRME